MRLVELPVVGKLALAARDELARRLGNARVEGRRLVGGKLGAGVLERAR